MFTWCENKSFSFFFQFGGKVNGRLIIDVAMVDPFYGICEASVYKSGDGLPAVLQSPLDWIKSQQVCRSHHLKRAAPE